MNFSNLYGGDVNFSRYEKSWNSKREKNMLNQEKEERGATCKRLLSGRIIVIWCVSIERWDFRKVHLRTMIDERKEIGKGSLHECLYRLSESSWAFWWQGGLCENTSSRTNLHLRKFGTRLWVTILEVETKGLKLFLIEKLSSGFVSLLGSGPTTDDFQWTTFYAEASPVANPSMSSSTIYANNSSVSYRVRSLQSLKVKLQYQSSSRNKS